MDARAIPVLFIQGGGAGTHDDWDRKLVDSLRRGLGPRFDVRYPRMPAESDPSYGTWAPAIRRELATLGSRAIVVGHSIGGSILIGALAVQASEVPILAIVLIAAPFVGDGGWAGDGFELPADLGARLPDGVPIDLFHGLDDDDVPPAHVELYGRAIPEAHVHRLPGRDHQLANDLTEVARVIRDRAEIRGASEGS